MPNGTGSPAAGTAAQDADDSDANPVYLGAEVMDEDALSRRIEQVRARQQQLVREYFDDAGSRPKDRPASGEQD